MKKPWLTEMECLNEENKKRYEDFLGNYGDSTPQHSVAWMNAIESSYKNCKSECYINKKEEKIISAFPFFIVKSKIFGKRIISQPFIDFGGPLGEFDEGFIEEGIKNLKENFKDVKHIEIRLNSLIPEYKKIEEILKKNGFVKELNRHQFILSLKTEEELWNNFSRITRKGIKKANKSELQIKEIGDKKELAIFYKLYLKSMKKFGTPQHSYKYFLNLFECKENFRGLNCYKDGKLISSLIVLYTKNYVYAAYNFSESKFLIYQPNDILYWEMIKWAMKIGAKYFDFGQCEINAAEGSHAAGIYNFKSKWGGILYERPFFYYSENESAEKGKKEKYKQMINVWKKLPMFIVKKIGPKIASQLAL